MCPHMPPLAQCESETHPVISDEARRLTSPAGDQGHMERASAGPMADHIRRREHPLRLMRLRTQPSTDRRAWWVRLWQARE